MERMWCSKSSWSAGSGSVATSSWSRCSRNLFVRLSTFEWALRSAGYSSAFARAIAQLHTASVLTKKANIPEGSLGFRYGNAFFNPWEGAAVPTKAYCERRTTGWIKWWLYLSVGESISFKSTGTEPNPTSTPVIKLDEGLRLRIAVVEAASRRFSMWDLTEEFVAVGIWPLAWGCSFSVVSLLATRELVTTEDDGTTNF